MNTKRFIPFVVSFDTEVLEIHLSGLCSLGRMFEGTFLFDQTNKNGYNG